MTSPEKNRDSGALERVPGFLLAAIVVAICLGATHRWMYSNGYFARPPIHDSSWYRLDSYRLREAWIDGGWIGWIKASWNLPGVHPPLLPAVTGLQAALLGKDAIEPRDLWNVTAFFGAILLAGVYRLARNFASKTDAVLATLAAGMSPGIACFLRPFDPQMPMAAMLVWSLDFLVRSRALTRPIPTALSGLATALAIQAKMLAPLYAVGPLVIAMIAARTGPEKKWPLKGLVIFVATAATGLCFWYPAHFWSVIAYTNSVTGGSGQELYSGAMPKWSAERWLYYPRVFCNQGFSFWTAVFVLAAVIGGLLRAAFRRDPQKSMRDRWIVAGSIIVAFVPLTLGQAGSHALYTIPFIAHGCTAIAAWIGGFDSPSARRLWRAAFLFAVVMTAWVTFRPIDSERPWAEFGGFTINGRTETRLGDAARAVGISATPNAEDWPIDAFVDEMAGRRRDAAVAYGFFAYADHPFMSASNFEYRAMVRRRRVFAQKLGLDRAPHSLDDFLAVRDVDYFLVHELTTREISPRPTTSEIIAHLERSGIRTTVVATKHPTPSSTLELVRVDWPRPGTFDALSEDSFDRTLIVVPQHPETASSPQFLGSRHVLFPGNHVALTTYWRFSAPDLAKIGSVKAVVTSPDVDGIVRATPLEFSIVPSFLEPTRQILAVSTDEFTLGGRKMTTVDIELTFGSSKVRERVMIGSD